MDKKLELILQVLQTVPKMDDFLRLERKVDIAISLFKQHPQNQFTINKKNMNVQKPLIFNQPTILSQQRNFSQQNLNLPNVGVNGKLNSMMNNLTIIPKIVPMTESKMEMRNSTQVPLSFSQMTNEFHVNPNLENDFEMDLDELDVERIPALRKRKRLPNDNTLGRIRKKKKRKKSSKPEGEALKQHGSIKRIYQKRGGKGKKKVDPKKVEVIDLTIDENIEIGYGLSSPEADPKLSSQNELDDSMIELFSQMHNDSVSLANPKEITPSIIRKKNAREKLKGHSCKDCEEFFKAVGLGDSNVINHCSRHRNNQEEYVERENTPEGYWDMDFFEKDELNVDNDFIETSE